MGFTRYHIRNEYGLADKQLYRAANKEDHDEALLEGASMAGLVGVLRQLGDLAEFAAEVFHCLHEEVMKSAAKGDCLALRLQLLETEFPSIEIPNHSTLFYNPGLEWQSIMKPEENLISPRNLPRCILDSYEECRGPPQLFLLDKFHVDGFGSCLKRYSDPSLLKTHTASAIVATSDLPPKPNKIIIAEAGTKVILTNYVEDHHCRHVFSVETESEISLRALLEDQFSSITNQDMEPEDISSDIKPLMPYTIGHIHMGNENLSASSWQEDALVNPDLTGEDPQTMSIVADDSGEHEVPILDTQRHDTAFGGHDNHNNKTCLNNKGSEYCLQTRQEIPSKSGSGNSMAASVESLPSRVSTEDVLHTGIQKICLDVSLESIVPFITCLHDSSQADPEIRPPLPPLPPTQWWMGKLVEPIKTLETQFSPVPSVAGSGCNNLYNHRVENHYFPEESIVEGVSNCKRQTTLVEPSGETEEQSPSEISVTRDTYLDDNESTPNKIEEKSLSSVSQLTADEELEANWKTEEMALEWFSQNLREHTNPNPAKLEDQHRSYDGNEKAGKPWKENDSLVIDMSRKVAEQNMTQVGARVNDESDSLLEIIQSKSFNLRPVDALERSNFQVAVPMTTNLKVAAILEKANTLRQAMAGSDEEHDSDSWSE